MFYETNQGRLSMKKLQSFCIMLTLLTSNAWSFSYADFVELEQSSSPENMQTEHLRSKRNLFGPKLLVDVYMRNFTQDDQAKVYKAKDMLEIIINSREFKQRVLNFTWKGKKQFNNNNGLTNTQIYDLLMTGEEVMMPGSTGIMNFDLTLYRSKNPWSKVKGYTLPDTMRIWMNKKFFRKSSWTPIDVAGNMAHEWVHKMGFGHDYNHNADRPYSVPYAVGYIVTDIAKEMGLQVFR
jgi:hypothetical protein